MFSRPGGQPRPQPGVPGCVHSAPPCRITEIPAISEQTIWLIAVGLIVLDLALFVVPVVPFVAAYVLVARPPWFKAFVDALYRDR